MKFYTCGNENSRTHLNEVMTQLSDQFIQEWFSHLNGGDKTTGNKLRTYKLFKNQFQLEHYLVCQIPTKHQIATTKFRVSCHNLAIETGRYHKPSFLPVEQRLCPTCREIEDEIHLLCQCRRNAGLRRNLFRTVTQYHTQFEMLDPVYRKDDLSNATQGRTHHKRTSSFCLQFSSLLVFFTDIWPPGLFMSLKCIIIITIYY